VSGWSTLAASNTSWFVPRLRGSEAPRLRGSEAPRPNAESQTDFPGLRRFFIASSRHVVLPASSTRPCSRRIWAGTPLTKPHWRMQRPHR
jgi:hypothetical protein